MSDRFLKAKSYEFALRIVSAVQDLQLSHGETVITKQLLWTGTNIGAHIAEAQDEANEGSHSSVARMKAASKEARECLYWLSLLKDSDILEETLADELILDVEELIQLVSSTLEIRRNRISLDPSRITQH